MFHDSRALALYVGDSFGGKHTGSENFLLAPNFLESFAGSFGVYISPSFPNGNINCLSDISLVTGIFLYSHLLFGIRS